MAVEITIKGEVVTACLSGEIDHHSAAGMREKIDEAIDCNMPSILVLDFGGVSFMDSSGIGLIMGRYRNLQKIGAKMNITGASPQISKVLRLAGMNRLAKLD
jgi:stage II sporulation protein AA (anti-sigma F factor antagonist)